MRKLKKRTPRKIKINETQPKVVYYDNTLAYNLEKDLGVSDILITLATYYMAEHRKLWDAPNSYLKPYYKGILTKALNKFKYYCKTYIHGLSEDLLLHAKERLFYPLEEAVIKIDNLNWNETDSDIFKSYVYFTVLIDTFRRNAIRKNKIIGKQKKDILSAIEELKKYIEFWKKDIDDTELEFL